MSECEMAEELIGLAKDEDPRVNYDHIYGAQFMRSNKFWIIYMANEETHALLLAVGEIRLGDSQRTFQITDFSTKGLSTPKPIRISIHGIPFHVSDAEITEWIKYSADIVSPVKKHFSKSNNFGSLLTGNRFCYVSKVTSAISRYTTYSTADLVDSRVLVDLPIMVFYEGQPVMCRYCKADHDIIECPILQRKGRKEKHSVETSESQGNPFSGSHTDETPPEAENIPPPPSSVKSDEDSAEGETEQTSEEEPGAIDKYSAENEGENLPHPSEKENLPDPKLQTEKQKKKLLAKAGNKSDKGNQEGGKQTIIADFMHTPNKGKPGKRKEITPIEKKTKISKSGNG